MKTFILREQRHLDNLIAFLTQNWEAMSKTKHPMAVECRQDSVKRSQAANRLYWATLHQIEAQAWVEGRQYPSVVWHEFAKRKFIGVVDLPGQGTMSQSSTGLNTQEFADYIQKVEYWAQSELGVCLVDPSEPIGRMR